MKSKFIPCFLVAAMVLNLMLLPGTIFAAASGSFDILSEFSYVNKEENITLTVVGKGISDMYACEVRLTFDNNLLDLVKVTSNVEGYQLSKEVGDNEILFAVAKKQNQLPESGDVTLLTINFACKKEGKAKVTLNTVRVMDEILSHKDYSLEKTIEVSIVDDSDGSPTPAPTNAPTPSDVPIASIRGDVSGLPESTPVYVDTKTGVAALELEELAESIFSGEGTAAFIVPSIPGVNAYNLRLPPESLSGNLGHGKLKFSTEMGSMEIPGNMLAGIPEAQEKEINISIAYGDKSGLPQSLLETIGDRPLVQLNLELDGIQTPWNNPQAPVIVSIPYTPAEEELADPEHIVVWYIDGKGNIISVPSGRYDPETGMVTFTVTHFSQFTIAYVHKTFNDLDSVLWAKKPIEVLASKGIIMGTGGNAYSPSLNINRADYLLLLIRTLGLWAEVEDNFDDVEQGDYYYEAVGIARNLGITLGVGNNRFLPGEPVTRQDMMVLTVRALEKFKGIQSAGDTAILEQFTDRGDIAGYAIENLAMLISDGLILGSGGKLYPREWTTRAEAAVFIYRIYNQYP